MQPATQAWGFAAVRLLGTVVIGCGAGWLFGNPFGGLAAALALHLVWVLANLARLEWWLRHRSYADPPHIGGGGGGSHPPNPGPPPPQGVPSGERGGGEEGRV